MSKLYQNAHWKRLRRTVAVRAAGHCERCGRETPPGTAHLHHRTYARAGAELESDVEMICLLCHGENHPDRTFLSTQMHRRLREQRGHAPRERGNRDGNKAYFRKVRKEKKSVALVRAFESLPSEAPTKPREPADVRQARREAFEARQSAGTAQRPVGRRRAMS